MSAARALERALRFVTRGEARIELAPWGKHWWLSEPELTGTKQLTLVRVTMNPGAGHQFHHHPAREEIIYVVEGVAEQWVDQEMRKLRPGEIAFIPKGVVHAIYNTSRKPMTFLAILSPSKARGPFLVDCSGEEPWRSLRLQKGRRAKGKRRQKAEGGRQKADS